MGLSSALPSSVYTTALIPCHFRPPVSGHDAFLSEEEAEAPLRCGWLISITATLSSLSKISVASGLVLVVSTSSKIVGEEVHTGIPLGDSGRFLEIEGVASVAEADTWGGDFGTGFELEE